MTKSITKKQITAVEKKVRCNINHSGNTRLTFDAGYFQCSGCGHFHTPEGAIETLMGDVSDWAGSGGLIRRS